MKNPKIDVFPIIFCWMACIFIICHRFYGLMSDIWFQSISVVIIVMAIIELIVNIIAIKHIEQTEAELRNE
jgi:hypothetical protein